MCAGLKVNVEKTKAKYIGSFWDRVDPPPLGLEWPSDYIEKLGVKLPVSKGDLYNLNFKNRILNLKNLPRLCKRL